MAEERGEVIVYRSPKGGSAVQLRAVGGTVWLTQRGIADLYATTVTNVNHIMRRILDDGEVTEATIDSKSMVRLEGSRTVRRSVAVYNLDMILAVGYRVTTRQAVLFRQWATTVLKEFLIKDFVLDDEQLKNPGSEPDYDRPSCRYNRSGSSLWSGERVHLVSGNPSRVYRRRGSSPSNVSLRLNLCVTDATISWSGQMSDTQRSRQRGRSERD